MTFPWLASHVNWSLSMDHSSIETLFPLVVDEIQVADATFLQLRRCAMSGHQIVAIRMAEWLVDLEAVDSHEDFAECSRMIQALDSELRRQAGDEPPGLAHVEADRDAITAAGRETLGRLELLSSMVESGRREGVMAPARALVAASKVAIAKCRQKLAQQRELLNKHEESAREAERRIVLSRAKLALAGGDGDNTHSEEDLVWIFEAAMRDTRAKRFALIDEKCAIAEQEQALRSLEAETGSSG